jgi:hypothetical protein
MMTREGRRHGRGAGHRYGRSGDELGGWLGLSRHLLPLRLV